MSSPHSSSLSMSTIDISLAKKSWKRVGSIKLSTKSGRSLKDIETTLRAGNKYKETFEPALDVKSDDHILVSADYSTGFLCRKRYGVVQVDVDLRDIERVREEQPEGVELHRKMTRNVEVVVRASCSPVPPSLGLPAPSLSHPMPDPTTPQAAHGPVPGNLVPTTDDLIRECAKFRVLVIGNSGVGKSTLIRKMFGVKDVHASDIVRGEADINKEFTSLTNERFVVHDSVGFEAGDEGRMQIVKDFVKQRQAMDRLQDQLHAIWLCVEIPHSGGRLVDAGVEQFLQHQQEIIGDIPLIVVLTKMDLLDIRLDLDASDKARGKESLESRRTRHLENYCIAPLQKAAGRDIPCVAVCVKEEYYVPIANLMKATNENMARHSIHEAPRAMASIAQRVDMKAKIETSVTIGEKKYWQNLQKSPFFDGRTLRDCLDVIRKDIVTVWNLNGLDDCLMDDKLIETLIPPDALADAGRSMRSRTTQMTLDDPQFILAAANEVIDVCATMLRKPYDKYRENVHGAEIFMSYIVNLICVVQVVFLLAPDSRVTPATVDDAIKACKDKRDQAQKSIKNFAEKRAPRMLKQDELLKEIGVLISRYSMSDQEVGKLRQQAS